MIPLIFEILQVPRGVYSPIVNVCPQKYFNFDQKHREIIWHVQLKFWHAREILEIFWPNLDSHTNSCKTLIILTKRTHIYCFALQFCIVKRIETNKNQRTENRKLFLRKEDSSKSFDRKTGIAKIFWPEKRNVNFILTLTKTFWPADPHYTELTPLVRCREFLDQDIKSNTIQCVVGSMASVTS